MRLSVRQHTQVGAMTLESLSAELRSTKLRLEAAILVHDGRAAEEAMREVEVLNQEIRRLCELIEKEDEE